MSTSIMEFEKPIVELEKQIDALNQKLTESQDELTFFRKAREGKKH